LLIVDPQGHDPAVLLSHLAEAGLWLERQQGSTLLLRRGQGPRYTFNSGLELIPDEAGGVLLSHYPLLAMRLNPQALALLQNLAEGATALEVVGQTPGSGLGEVTNFLEGCTRRRLLSKQPSELTYFPFISVIIPAHNRPSATRACVETLLALAYPADRLEIIVVDDGSDPPLAPLLTD
jgi:hypothetical protein